MFALWLSTALAGTNEVAATLGWLDSGDPAWQVLAQSGACSTWGGHVGLKVHDRVTVLAGYRHGVVGADLGASDWEDGDGDERFTSVGTAFYGNTFTLGARADWNAVEFFAPYARVDAQGLLGMVRLDDEPDDDENVTQRQKVSFAPGFDATLGLSFPVPTALPSLYVTPFLEMGYGWVAPLKLGDLGRVQPAGFTGQGGIALQF